MSIYITMGGVAGSEPVVAFLTRRQAREMARSIHGEYADADHYVKQCFLIEEIVDFDQAEGGEKTWG